jgi:Fe-S cluster assembly scaffold protein SufB
VLWAVYRGQSVPAPNLMAEKKGVEITHEAKTGKIFERQITHFTTREFLRNQAVSLVIRGFINAGMLGLPDAMNIEITRTVDASTEAALTLGLLAG